jgi:hypothetical protein
VGEYIMGGHYFVHVACNSAPVNNVEATRRNLEEFDIELDLEVIETGSGGEGKILVRPYQWDAEYWPTAVKMIDIPDGPDAVNDDEDEYEKKSELRDQLHQERGAQGFIDLLLSIAPYLVSPLIIQAASFTNAGEFYGAAEWTVRPGATEVEIKEIDALEKDE